VFFPPLHELPERHLTRVANHGKSHRHKVVGPDRLATRVDGLLLLPTCENFFYKFFVQRIFKNIDEAEDDLLGVVLTCTGKMGKSCCERTVEGPWIRYFTIRPYLSDHLAKLARQLTRAIIAVAKQRVGQERHVCQALHGGVEITGVAEIRQPLHHALKQNRS
jgi:hypothetical protein